MNSAGRHGLARTLTLACLLVSAACNRPGTDGQEDAGSVGRGCVTDLDCNGYLCLDGLCQVAAPDAGSRSPPSSSGGSVSSGEMSSSGGNASSQGMDAGMGDASVPQGAIATDPPTGPLDFGAARLGISVQKTVLITNVGDGPLAITNVGIRYVDALSPQEFSVEPVTTTPSSLAPAGQFGLRVTYTPQSGEGNHAYLSLVTSAANAPVTELELVAGFKGDPLLAVHLAPGDTGANTNDVALGPVPIGGSATAHLYLLNAGAEGSALVVRGVSLAAGGSNAFSVHTVPLPTSLSSFPGVCAAGAACVLTTTSCVDGLCVTGADAGSVPVDVVDVVVTFQASTPGVSDATLNLQADGHGRTFNTTVALHGTAQVGGLVAVPNPLGVGNAFVGYPTRTTLHLQNGGNIALSVNALDWQYGGAAAPFSVDLGSTVLPRMLTPGSSFDVAVVFNPDALGGFSDTLRVHPGLGTALEVPVTGTAVDKPTVHTPASVEFGDQQVGSARLMDLVVGNDGPGVLTVTRLSISSTGTTPFTFAPSQVVTPIAAGQSTTLQVTYAPQVITAGDTANLVVESNDPAHPSVSVPLHGRPIGPVASVTPSSGILDFGFVAVGAAPSPTLSFQVRNPGVGALTVNSDLTVKNAADVPVTAFAALSDRLLPATVLEGGGDVLTLTCSFTPTANGPVSGSLRLNTNDPTRQQVTVIMTGTGVACSPNHVPTPTFGGGMCNGVCEAGYDDCNANKQTDGCEVTLASDVNNCGGCHSACSTDHITATCGAGQCNGACMAGYADCNVNKRTDGCEVGIQSDVNNCGGCFLVCSASNISSPTCGGGQCNGACNTGFSDCDGNKQTNGCETDTRSNADRCGGCTNICSANNISSRTCASGVCNGACNPSFGDCDGNKLSNGCETDLRVSPDHCGSCTSICSSNHVATRACTANVCTGLCAAGYLDCNSDKLTDGCEIDRLNDNANCGTCGNVCASNAACVNGNCAAVCGIKVNEVQPGPTGDATNEYVELFNSCPTAINVSAWTVRYKAASNSGETTLYTFPALSSMASGAFFLIAGSGYTGTKDATYLSGFSNSGGGVAVFDAAPSPNLVDSMTYEVIPGIHTFTETAPAVHPPTTAPANSVQRFPDGADTNNNLVDFSIRAAHTPRAPNQ